MKNLKYLFSVLLMIIVFGVTSVKAEELKVIVIFTSDTSSLTINPQTGAITGYAQKYYQMGDTITFNAKECTINTDNISSTTTAVTLNSSNCSTVNATWTSSNTSVMPMSNNVGTVNGYGTTNITAKVSGHEDAVSTFTFTQPQTNEPTNPTPTTPTNDGTSKWRYLFIVDGSTKKVTISTVPGPRIEKELKAGETAKFSAIICSDDKATVSNGTKTWNVSDCKAAPNPVWSINGDGAMKIDQTGTVTALKDGFGQDNVMVSVKKSDLNLGENEYFMETHNLVAIYVYKVNYDGSTTKPTKTTTTKTNTFTKDVVTYDNPSTGIEDYFLYALPFVLITGSYLALRKRNFN